MGILKRAPELDEAGNLVFNKDGIMPMLEGKECFGQMVRNILLTRKGEDSFSPIVGNDYLNHVAMVRGADAALFVQMCIRMALLPQVWPRIKKIEELSIDFWEDRTLRLTLRIVDVTNRVTTMNRVLMI